MRSALLAFWIVLIVVPAAAAPNISLQVGITGSNSLRGLDDPVTVARLPEVSQLLMDIADAPRSAEFIDDALKGSSVDRQRLLALGLIKQYQGNYALAFNYFTLEDHATLLRVLAPYSESLADLYRDRWDEFRTHFSTYGASGVGEGKIAYAVLGAMSLDWDGLDLTAQKDMRLTPDKLPAGRNFILWAKEQSAEINVRGLYWGSHNAVAGGMRYTSFGDHYTTPRHALPDILWRTNNRVRAIEDAPEELGRGLYQALRPYYFNEFLADLAPLLRALRTGPQTLSTLEAAGLPDKNGRVTGAFALLVQLEYVREHNRRYELTTPIFTMADKLMIDEVRTVSWQMMDAWLKDNFEKVETDLGDLTAMKHGVPYTQLFSQIWHYIFGMANRSLVESGHFSDPYAEERLAKGIIPFTYDTGAFSPVSEIGN